MILSEIERRALEIAAEVDRTSGPYYAEIVPDVTPHWHVVHTAPGAEKKAYYFLSHRRFGVFLPTFVKGSRIRHDNEMVDVGETLIFPGKVFVWVWDVLAHWRRITACPGVQKIMCNRSEKPCVLPDDEKIGIQVLEFRYAIPRSRRRRKRYGSTSNDMITITSADYLHVDGHKRNHVLDAVLLRAAS